MIGVNPQGAATFISDAFEGSISDKAITKASGFYDFIDQGDVVCADRGFTIEEELLEKGALLKIPPFMKGKSALSIEEEAVTKIIAKARIHVERFNQRMKIFQWLKGPIPQKRMNLLSQGVLVCGCLANFSRILIQ